jgi:hypothetical protein
MHDRFGECIRPEDLTVKPTETAFFGASPAPAAPANSPRRGILRRRRKERTLGTGIPRPLARSGSVDPGVAALANASTDEWDYCSVAIFECSGLGSATIQARKLAKLAHPRGKQKRPTIEAKET